MTNNEAPFIKTAMPLSCIVAVLYHPTKHISALAHIDDFTSAASAIKKICNKARDVFSTPCSPDYQATLLGGTQDPFSLKSKKTLIEALKKYKIKNITSDPLSKNLKERPQIFLDARNGKIEQLKGKDVNQKLEYLQRREYGEWNRWLDVAFDGVPGENIPYFEAKLATRYEEKLPAFRANNENELAETKLKEKQGKLKLPIFFERKEVASMDDDEL